MSTTHERWEKKKGKKEKGYYQEYLICLSLTSWSIFNFHPVLMFTSSCLIAFS